MSITVPKKYKHRMTKTYRTTDDYKPQIRALIDYANGTALTQQDFNDKTGTTTGYQHVKKLMKQGYITRKAVKANGKRAFIYSYHSTPMDKNTAALANGEVVTIAPPIPKYPIKLPELEQELLKYSLDPDRSGDINGAIDFTKWLRLQSELVEKQRLQQTERR